MYFVVAFVALGTLLIYIVSRGGKLPDLSKDLKLVDAAVEAEKLKKQLGHEKAVASVLEKYKNTINELDEQQTQEAKHLANDPVALSKFLVKAGTRRM
jgi:hypothetical protein